MDSRRDSLKIIGAIGATCAYPFSADELYGQHTHTAPVAQIQAAKGPYTPRAFTQAEFQLLTRLTDLIIPPTETPGAAAAGVPQYIDEVVTTNKEHQPKYQTGLAWLNARAKQLHGKEFLSIGETEQIAILTPLCDASDRNQLDGDGEKFFRLLKNMTADGYYTSAAGLIQELGYQGNTVLASFPGCTHPEHKS